MALKTYKPVTPSRRFMVTVDNTDLSKVKPEKSLLEPIKKMVEGIVMVVSQLDIAVEDIKESIE